MRSSSSLSFDSSSSLVLSGSRGLIVWIRQKRSFALLKSAPLVDRRDRVRLGVCCFVGPRPRDQIILLVEALQNQPH